MIRVALYRARMSDPNPGSPPGSPPDTTEPNGTPVENPSGSAAVDNSGGIEANEINPDVPLIDPTGD